MHFECDFVPFRIQTLTQSHPCYNNLEIKWHFDPVSKYLQYEKK